MRMKAEYLLTENPQWRCHIAGTHRFELSEVRHGRPSSLYLGRSIIRGLSSTGALKLCNLILELTYELDIVRGDTSRATDLAPSVSLCWKSLNARPHVVFVDASEPTSYGTRGTS